MAKAEHALNKQASRPTNKFGRKFAVRATIIFVTLLFILRFVPAGTVDEPGIAGVLAGLVALVMLAYLLAYAIAESEPAPTLHWDNELLEDRVMNLIDFLSLANNTIAIVTGSLDSGLYADKRVKMAFDQLDSSVKIYVYHENDMDTKSLELLKFFWERRASIVRIQKNAIEHAIIVDGRHIKIESFGVPDGADEKHADYYTFNIRKVNEYRRTLNALEIFDSIYSSKASLDDFHISKEFVAPDDR